MKKIISLILLLTMSVVMLAACQKAESGGSTGSDAGIDPSKIKTMEDVFAFSDEVSDAKSQEYSETKYVIAFELNGTYYRAEADMPKDVADQLFAIDFDAEDKEDQERALISPLEVTSFQELNDQILGQEALDKLVGKTGQELFDDGWTYWFYDLESMQAGMYYGPFSYNVEFAYDGEPMENTDDFDFYEEFKDLKVKSASFEGMGNASAIE